MTNQHDEIDRIFAKAIYPQVRNWDGDPRFIGEVLKRARKARAALLAAGYEIVPATAALLEKGKQDVPSGKVR